MPIVRPSVQDWCVPAQYTSSPTAITFRQRHRRDTRKVRLSPQRWLNPHKISSNRRGGICSRRLEKDCLETSIPASCNSLFNGPPFMVMRKRHIVRSERFRSPCKAVFL